MSEKNEAIVQNGECSMVEHLERHGVSRREFMTACSVVTATMAVPTFFRSGSAEAATLPSAAGAAAAAGETTTWSSCVVNCGSRCPLKVVVKDGQVVRIEPENTGIDACDTPHVRACVRGRSMRMRLYSEERLKYPMKRVGARGEGKFERISWEEAYTLIANSLRTKPLAR